MTEELIRAKTTALPPNAGHSLLNAIPGLRSFESVERIDTGFYAITITAQTSDAALLIPIVTAAWDPSAPPSDLPIVTVGQISERMFGVSIATFDLETGFVDEIDYGFVFMVTGR